MVGVAGEVRWLGLLGCLHVSGDLIRSHDGFGFAERLLEDVSPVHWRETYLKFSQRRIAQVLSNVEKLRACKVTEITKSKPGIYVVCDWYPYVSPTWP